MVIVENIIGRISRVILENGGRAYYVGGYVRDKLMGIKNISDIDIEVHGLSPLKLEKILSKFGNVLKFGKSFGVYSIEGLNIDFTIPRVEKNTGDKHRDFNIILDPKIGTKIAASRRDFTINSIMLDIETNEYIDHFGGIKDLENKLIRHISKLKFKEDPLRVLRAAQFASRFNFTIADETVNMCRDIDLTKLSKERVKLELDKALTLSDKPSIFFEYLDEMDKLWPWFNEIKKLQDIDQDEYYHAEGNVFNHTMLVIDAATKYKDKISNYKEFMYSSLCHDLGKIKSTKFVNGKLKSIGHEEEGVIIAKEFLRRLTKEKKLIKYVQNMTFLHMRPNIYAKDNSKLKSTNRMFYDSIDPIALIYLSQADKQGRISKDKDNNSIDFLLNRYEKFIEIMDRPFFDGHDLVENGVVQNENFSKIKEFALKQRLSNVKYKIALKNTLRFANKINKEVLNEN